MFNWIGEAVVPHALYLGFLCQQTIHNGDWHCDTIVCHRGFPWLALLDLIRAWTDKDEYTSVLAFSQHSSEGQAQGVTGQAGNLLCMFKTAEFVNLLYAALQLTVKVDGNLSMWRYRS